MAVVNYAEKYAQALANAYPYVLNYGALWSTENSSKYQVVDAKTIQIPVLKTSGRIDGDRDTIGGFKRRHDNDWETKTLSNHREWDTLIHPKDVMESNMIMSIQNATKTFNETQKFPEMDAYLISKLFELKSAISGVTIPEATLDKNNVLTYFDTLMDEMDEALVPAQGRVLYVDTFTKTLIDNAKEIVRSNGQKTIERTVSRIGEVEIISVPSKLIQTKYDFTEGWKAEDTAKQINLFLVHPSAVLPIVSYSFAQMQEPSALTKGKYVYFEESFEDVFILNKKHDAIKFVTKVSE